ncbi:MAG: chitobiase/beta-hexosaminidase C-terminal domain-containing protein [Bacteroidaceae bacterium]|nr:chitobiase/beta-hexosaminidase C-terminal domain-containing protein [Bacteroidaceae bacterium]
MGTKHSQPGNKTGFRLLVSLLLMLVLGSVSVWGQTHPYAGVWFMKVKKNLNYYMVPAANPQVTTANHVNEDAYFSSNYSTQAGDPEKPFVTTYQTSGDLNSIWIFVPVSGENNYYYIVHAKTGKYVKYQQYLSGDNACRKFVHLETMVTPGETEKFEITKLDDGVRIKPKNNAMYFNVAGDNQNRYNGGTSSPYYSGMVGGMNGTDTNSQFNLTNASTSTDLTPVISDVNETDNTFTITSPAAAFSTIRYTTDGSTTPDASTGTSATSGSPITITGNWSVQAVGVFDTFVTPVAGPKELAPAGCAKPIITYDHATSTVSITCPTANASIYYKTDGSDPTNGTQYSSAFPVSDGMIIKAIAKKSGLSNSDIASLTIVLNPTINIDGGPFTYNGTQQQPAVTVKKGDDVINPTEYQVSYGNNIDVGNSATVTISDVEGGEYYVAGSTTFTISPMSIGSGSNPVSGITIDVVENGGTYSVIVKHNDKTLIEGTDYEWNGGTVGEDYVVTVTGKGNYSGTAQTTYVAATPGYYVLHQNGKGYLKVSGAGVNLENDGTFQSGNLFDKGNCIWYMTPEGYLQNEYFYLNAANNNTLYLSVNPVTRWRSEDVTGENTYGKKHLKINNGTSDLYLCNDGNSITLKTSPSAYYSACPVTVEEVSWPGTPAADNLTVQSPQLVTYLRAYFTQKIKYNFRNDAGAEVKSTDGKHERRVYATIAYKEGGSKGTDWNIDESGILYNKKASGDVEFTATYNILPADPVTRAAHPTPASKDIKYKVTQKPLALTADMDYLLYSISGGDSYRYPYDNGIADGGAVKPDGKGGRENTSVLTDPDTDKNLQISWKITADEEGFYTFQNSNTDKYLYYDETAHTSSDFGVLRLSSAPTGNSAKFRLYKTSDTNYSECYYLIPYSKLFAVYKSNAVADGLYVALNNKDYTGDTPVISLSKPNANSTWCIYKYEAEYRIREDFTITGPSSAEAVGNYNITSEGWYGRYIKQSPRNGSGQRGLVIKGTYKDNVDYIWTVTGLGNYINISDGTNTDGTWSITTNGNNRKLVVNVTSLPVSTTSGVITLKLSGYSAPNTNVRTSSEKTFAFTILGNGTISFTDITSLAGITSSSGAYRLVGGNGSNFVYSASNKPGITTFSGILDGNNQTISGLNAPLFDNLTNGTVRNVNLSGVGISNHSGPTGAIAGTADGGSRIYNVGILDGEVGSNGDVCGGLVGKLDGSARVINCFSYATITGGTTVGGIVGNNTYASKSNDMRTMVMNCMFYGDITDGDSKAPIYNGQIITNRSDENGVGNFNYFWAGASYVQGKHIDVYNCALSAETRFLQRFEFFRHLLNSNRALAAWWATGSRDKKNEMLKWVLEPSQIGTDTPYPILKPFGKYPSVVNIDADHAEDFSADADTKKTQYNQGRKFGTLTINIRNASSGSGSTAPSGANITTSSVTPNITDKDSAHFNFNYYKVQLPYYNDVGTKNYTDNKVVTGWKIVTISGGTHSFSTGEDATATADEEGNITLTTPYNFADRKSTDKDKFDVSGRVFSQGAYFDVPEGVSSITIEPYWGKCVYVSDTYPDVVYNQGMSTATNVTTVGGGQRYTNGKSYDINGNSQAVYTTMGGAVTALNPSGSVYDNAIVLVGNVHSLSLSNETKSKPYTIMSIDLDKDNEPDYSYILRFDSRKRVHPVRVDFLNVIGLGMAQKSNGGTGTYNFGIMQPYGWFECTNTGLFRVTQLEYDLYDSNSSTSAREESPMILQGGVIEQWVTVGGAEDRYQEAKSVTYYHVGGNVWFKEFHIGVHQDKTKNQFISKHPPISVTGGDYDIFYLTGYYNSPNNNYDDNAECYINGGRFNKVAGTGMQGIGNLDTHANGNITWQIDNADINEFYGGGINAAHIAEGNIMTVISNSRVDQFCGGPKFGDMNSGRKVVTNATNCTFRTFFGAGYGGNSYNRRYPANQNNVQNINWNTWVSGDNGLQYRFNSTYGGVETRIDYQFIPMSNNTGNVARLFVDYVSFSLATTRDVTSKLTDCTITKSPLGSLDLFSQCVGNFYGGGNLGMVDGPVKSTLTNCTVEGSVFGAGYSASMPPVAVMNNSFQTSPKYDSNLGTYLEAVMPSTETYTWQHRDVVNSTETAIDRTNHILYTTEDLTTLGAVTGNVTLTIDGNTTLTNGKVMSVAKSVYGGGEESNVAGDTRVNISGGTIAENVFGGGKGVADEFACSKAMIGLDGEGANNNDPEATKDKGTIVNISDGTVNGNVYGGGEVGRVEWNTQVKIGEDGTGEPVIKGYVFGAGKGLKTHGYAALVRGNPTVTIQGNAKIKKSVYGGGEIASVARYKVATTAAEAAEHGVEIDMPYALANNYSGNCKVIVGGNAVIGPDEPMKMYHPEITDGTDKPDDAGHVFAAGKGVLPEVYTYADNEHRPKRMLLYNAGSLPTYWEYADAAQKNIWEYFEDEDAYFAFVKTLALSSQTEVTIKDNAFVKGSVYGGSENGLVQFDTDVKIQGGQIGCGKDTTEPYGDEVWANEYTPSGDLECASWSYEAPYAPYDPYANATGDLDKYPKVDAQSEAKSTEGGRRIASDGHTYYGNVFGGGSGSVPYFDTQKGISRYVSSAGMVKGNTKVTISGGHILTNVYGGCESTNVKGSATITMTGGTVGVPRTVAQIVAHPLTGYIFGAGKGDQRIFFNKETNVDRTFVNIEGGRVYGSIFGGGEDGHVFQNTTVNIGKDNDETEGPTIGTTGTSYVDGNVFGGGRGFGGEALTAGNIGGSVELNIKSGKILGSVYGGGRLASVGYGLYLVDEEITEGEGKVKPYGILRPDDQYDGSYSNPSAKPASTYYNKGRGYITINISGGTIGNDAEYIYNPTDAQKDKIPYTTFDYQNHLQYTKGGNVFTGGMGRLYALDNSTLLTLWPKLGKCKGTTLNMTGGTVKSSVYGGGEIGAVAQNATVNINSGTVGTKVVDSEDATKYYYFGSVFGGGKGSTANVEGISEAGTTGGNVEVNLNKTVASDEAAKGAIVSQVFGCNDMNGSPKGNVTVHIYATQNADKENISTKYDKGSEKFDVMAVYGGGNLAAYEPTSSTGSTKVIIDGCGLTSIKQVYGGGNAASTPATQVDINETYEIDEAFGGGNGKDKLPNGDPNPGANVGYTDYSAYETSTDENKGAATKDLRIANYQYGSGEARMNIHGGTVHRVYGGSNTKGNVRITAVTMLEDESGCPFEVEEAYGGGKSAPMDATSSLEMACIPGLSAAYGGAEDAQIEGDVNLTITNGTFDRVFGGNNVSGEIKGTITVNIEETGCKPIIIGQLYGGGNQAPYTAPDGKPGPTVNVRSFTSIGDIYGGGYGAPAKVVADTHVNINVGDGRYKNGFTYKDGKTVNDYIGEKQITFKEYERKYNSTTGKWDFVYDENGTRKLVSPDPSITITLPSKSLPSKIGAIQNVYGGGNAAEVDGDTYVNIGTNIDDAPQYTIIDVKTGESVEDFFTKGEDGKYNKASGTAVEGTNYYMEYKPTGVDIRGNVYGGGNNAKVWGNTHVNIGKD